MSTSVSSTHLPPIGEPARHETGASLQATLVELIDLSLAGKQLHWSVVGPQFRRVTLTNKERFGLLGKAAVLMRTSYPDRTSPVLRGAWVLDKLMGTPPTPPPPDTATDLSQKEGEQPKTVRARLELHRDKATCKMCHGVIDPTGLALENFDPIGRWRDADSGQPIDATTTLPGGIAVSGPSGLREALLSRPELFVSTLTEKLMVYALGRRLEAEDMPTVRHIVRDAARDDYKFSALVLGIVRSPQYQEKARFTTSATQTVADVRASADPTGASK